MELTRRGFLKGMAGILAAGAAPAIITRPGLLMPVRKLWTPEYPQAAAWFDGRIWIVTNSGDMHMTVTGMECDDWMVKTPMPIDLQPGHSIAFAQETKVFSHFQPGIVADYKRLWKS